MTRAVSRRPLTPDVPVYFHSSQYWICDGRSDSCTICSRWLVSPAVSLYQCSCSSSSACHSYLSGKVSKTGNHKSKVLSQIWEHWIEKLIPFLIKEVKPSVKCYFYPISKLFLYRKPDSIWYIFLPVTTYQFRRKVSGFVSCPHMRSPNSWSREQYSVRVLQSVWLTGRGYWA